jgi:hypothetical protein
VASVSRTSFNTIASFPQLRKLVIACDIINADEQERLTGFLRKLSVSSENVERWRSIGLVVVTEKLPTDPRLEDVLQELRTKIEHFSYTALPPGANTESKDCALTESSAPGGIAKGLDIGLSRADRYLVDMFELDISGRMDLPFQSAARNGGV